MSEMKLLLKKYLQQICLGYDPKDVPKEVLHELNIDMWKSKVRNPPYKNASRFAGKLFLTGLAGVLIYQMYISGVTLNSVGWKMMLSSGFFALGYGVLLIGSKIGNSK